jgi:hypothetical protein
VTLLLYASLQHQGHRVPPYKPGPLPLRCSAHDTFTAITAQFCPTSAPIRLYASVACGTQYLVSLTCCQHSVQGKIKKFHTASLYCSAVHLVWTSFALDFGAKAELGSMDRTLCILFCLQNGTLIRPASTRFVIGTAVGCSVESICAGWSLWRRLIYGGGWIWHGDSSHNIPMLMPCRFCLGPR